MWKILLPCLISAGVYPLSAHADPVQWIEGRWAVDLQDLERISPEAVDDERTRQCHNNPEVISVGADKKTIRFSPQHPKPEDRRADDLIVDVGSDYLKILCDRKAVDADCNDWDWYIYFRGADQHVWVRSDWIDKDGKVLGTTAIRRRCADQFI